jgi:uncharacterized protein YkwD
MNIRFVRLGSLIVANAVSQSQRRNVYVGGRIAAAAMLALGCASKTMVGSPPAPSSPVSNPPAADYAQIELEVLRALNTARSSPQTAMSWMDELSTHFSGKYLLRPGATIPIVTNEGITPVREAIEALRAQPPVQLLSMSAPLSRAARDQVLDQSRTGNTGHTGSDGSSTATRVGRYATWQVSLSENIDYGPFATGREVIENLIVDDGVANRGHRRNIYDPTARFVGIACGPHPKYGASCVIVQAGGVTSK